MRTEAEKDILRKAFDELQRELIVISKEYEVLTANRFAIQQRGAPLVGVTCHQAIFGKDAPCPDCPVAETQKTGKPAFRDRFNEPVVENKNIACYPIYAQGAKDTLVMVDFDLPQIFRLEGELQRSNGFLRNILYSAVDSVIAADTKGKVIIFNEAAAEVSGYSIEEALTDLDIRQVYPDDGARDVMRKLRSDDYGGKGKLSGYHVDVIGKGGERIPISLYASIVYENDREVASIGFFHDLRERIKIQKELEKTQQQLMQADKMASLGKLAAGVAHQLNNPLGSITLYAKLMGEENELEQAAREDLDRIVRDAQRCRDTVRELLEFARQTRQFMKMQDINRAISRTLFLLENQTLFHNIEIVKELAENLPMVYSDVQQLNHMFMNIILNAGQAMKGQGKLKLRTELSADEKYVVIEITDNGPGIPEDTLHTIFEPFYTTKDEGEGTGLGLSVVYGIVQNHKGFISAQNRPEGGAVFLIELPVNSHKGEGAQDE